MDDEILEAIQASVDFAKASPFPKPESAVDDIFA
jgi:TPP-dependent pyruvate/acetoin dehydrogenase alpha subunit